MIVLENQQQSGSFFTAFICLFWTFVPPMLNTINPSLPAATSLTHSTRPVPPLPHDPLRFFIMKHPGKPTHTLLRKNPPLWPFVHHPGPPHASHVPLRQGARHWAPPSFCPSFYPCTPIPSIISAHPPTPRSPSCPYKGSKPKKRKGRKEEKNTAATMQNSAGQSTAYCPRPCPSLAGLSQKHTLFSQETTAPQLGGWNLGCVAI